MVGEQVEKRFIWILKNFSTLQDECYYSRPFLFAGLNWHIIAFPKAEGCGNTKHLSLYLGLADPGSMPSGWRREVKFRLTVVNKIWKDSTKLLGQNWFDAITPSWGFKEFLPLFKLGSTDEGYLVGDNLIIVAQLHVFPAIVVKTIESLSKKGDEASDASVNKSQGDSSCQVVEQTENDDDSQENDVSKKNPCVDTSHEGLDDDDASEEDSDEDDEESSDDDDDASEEGSDDDDEASSLVSGDGSKEKSPFNQPNPSKDGSLTVENCGMRCNNVASETEVSNVDNDDAPRGDSQDDAFENDDTVRTNVASVTEASNGLLREIQPVEETVDVNGFQVSPSQVESVSHIFKRHPDIALGFRPRNQQIRSAYMNELLSLIEMLCQSPEKLSEDDLSNADETLADLIDVGFKLDWLKSKLNEVSEKKKLVQGSVARIQTRTEMLQKRKLMVSLLETLLKKEKAKALAARAPLSFNDVVC